MDSRCDRASTSVDRHRCVALVAALVLYSACSCTQRSSSPPTLLGPPAELAFEQDPVAWADSYYLSTCAVCDGVLGAKCEALDFVCQGRGIRVCCRHCRDAFAAAPGRALAHVDARMIADQLPMYPLETSLFDNRPLGEHALDFIAGNRLFRVVDSAERERVLTDPVGAIRKLDCAVLAAQRPTYGMPDKCPVQGDILPGDHKLDIVVANRMIRVCCGRCARVVRTRPYQYLGMVEYANRQAVGPPEAADGRR